MTPPSAALPTASLLAAALLLGACGTAAPPPSGPGGATPTASTSSRPGLRPLPVVTSVPLPSEPVTGQGTVLQRPDGPPELCLGPVAESWPPQAPASR